MLSKEMKKKKARTKEKQEEGRRKKRKKRRQEEDKHVTTLKQMGSTKSLKSARVPPDLARQFVSRHLCTALAVPLLWHTEILWRQYEEKEDAAQVVPAMEVPWAMLLQRAMKSWRPLPNAPSLSMASGRKPRPSCWQAGPYFWRLQFSASLAACPARQEAVSASASTCSETTHTSATMAWPGWMS